MRREIDDQDAAAGLHHADGLAQSRLWIIEVMKDLMENDGIKAVFGVAIGEGQAVKIAAPHLAMRRSRARQFLPGKHKHLRTLIDPDTALDVRRQQFQQPYRAGACARAATEALLP